MVLSDAVHLPSEEELKHTEIPVGTSILRASAMHLGKYCDLQCKEFMLCRKEEKDPRRCLTYGHEVTQCGLEFYKKVKKTCRGELEWYTTCLEYTANQFNYRKCRKEQAIYDTCMMNAGFERAPFGYFEMVRVHDSERPKPKPFVPLFPDPTAGFDYENKGKDLEGKDIPAGGSRPRIGLMGFEGGA